MTQLLGFPSPADVAAQTPVDRDRVIDVIRIGSLLGVVVGHTVMATSMIRDHVLIWDNLLNSSTALQALTWVFQIMPLFFFAGAAACVLSWRPGASWGGWLMKRCTRLYRPVFYYLAFWAVVLVALRAVLPRHVFDPVAGVSIQLLWFLGAYILVLAATPLLYRITSTGRLAVGVAGVYAGVALVDLIRLHTSTGSPLGYLNMAAWAIPGMFGVAYRRNLLSPRAALRIGLAMLGVNVLLCWAGPYEVSLVGIGDQHLANMSPPSLLMAGHAIMMCGFAIWAAPAIARWAQRPRVWWLTVIGNTGAMTLYLWHIPALLGMHLVFDSLGWFRFPGQPHLLRAEHHSGDIDGRPGQRVVRDAAATGEFTAARLGRPDDTDAGRPQCGGRRAAVLGVGGNAGLGEVGLEGRRPVLRDGDAGRTARGADSGHDR